MGSCAGQELVDEGLVDDDHHGAEASVVFGKEASADHGNSESVNEAGGGQAAVRKWGLVTRNDIAVERPANPDVHLAAQRQHRAERCDLHAGNGVQTLQQRQIRRADNVGLHMRVTWFLPSPSR